jgi:hypothetical protein
MMKRTLRDGTCARHALVRNARQAGVELAEKRSFLADVARTPIRRVRLS